MTSTLLRIKNESPCTKSLVFSSVSFRKRERKEKEGDSRETEEKRMIELIEKGENDFIFCL